MAEYLLIFFLVVAAMSAMSIYFKRLLQARLRDARMYMVNDVMARTNVLDSSGNAYYNGVLYYDYEPYYTETDSTIERITNDEDRVLSGIGSGRYQKVVDESTTIDTQSTTLPPRNAI